MVTAIFQNENAVKTTDTVIIGHGPSALFLSYLLHGHEPFYHPHPSPHPDPVLHRKLCKALSDTSGKLVRPLYNAIENSTSYESLTSHFEAAQFMSYSSQALPLNVLMDTLLRPLADIAIDESPMRVRWELNLERSVDHMVLGREVHAGGQWAGDEVWFGEEGDCEKDEESGMRTLSYAEMLSLPGYSIHDHYRRFHNGKDLAPDVRPTRRLVADYYATYPSAVGISDSIHTGVSVLNVERIIGSAASNFLVTVSALSSRTGANEITVIHCKNVVLGSGIFSSRIPAPQILRPLTSRPSPPDSQAKDDRNEELPLLVIGSGYTAADVILSNQKSRPILHVYRWRPAVKASPLKGCHPQVYPQYAQVYKRMKEAALGKDQGLVPGYEGCPNGAVIDADEDGYVKIALPPTGEAGERVVIERRVSGVQVCIGRRGRIDYLSRQIREEIGVIPDKAVESDSLKASSRRNGLSEKEIWVRSNSLRLQVERDFEVASNIFVVGSLTGDSLVRFAMGGCVYAAGKILERAEPSSIPSVNTTVEAAAIPNGENSDTESYVIVDGPSALSISANTSSISVVRWSSNCCGPTAQSRGLRYDLSLNNCDIS